MPAMVEFFWPIAQMFEITLRQSFTIAAPGSHRPRALIEHRAVLDAIAAGDAEAARAYSEAFGRDPAFAQFYRSLEAYRASFASKSDVLVMDPSSEFFKGLRSSAPAAR